MPSNLMWTALVNAAVAALITGVAPSSHAAPANYVFSQSGFPDHGVISGSFTGEDLNLDGRLASFDGEISDFWLSFNGNSIIAPFTHSYNDLFALSFDIPGSVLGDGGSADPTRAEGLASNWWPEGEEGLAGDPARGYAFANGIGPLGGTYAEIGDWVSGARLLSNQAMTVSVAVVPEPSTWALWMAGWIAVSAIGRRTRRAGTMHRVIAGLTLGAGALSAHAQVTTILQQSFTSSLGQFTAQGSVATGAAGARLTANAWLPDGSITSARLSTSGYQALSLSYDRSCSAGLTGNEAGVAEYSINGGPYTQLESTRNTAVARATFPLPASAANASIVLRFRISANAATKTCTVNNVALTGTGATLSSNRPPIGKFVTFESGHVRPLALSSDGQRLYAVNTPDNRVEVFDVSSTTPRRIESIPVGLEPVALALAPDGRLWVVNHLSDSVSIVDLSVSPSRVVSTLLVGDEPRDIVFAGLGQRWAFITAAHRGQNVAFDPQLTTPGVGRADVWVFNATSTGTALGGIPVTVLTMFGDTLRALAKSADGLRVYAAVFNSGNKTTVLDDDLPNGGLPSTGSEAKPPPYTSKDRRTQPRTGLIVQKNAAGDWMDSGDPVSRTPPKSWNSRVKLNLPDYDVFSIDASGTVPTVSGKVSGVGTTLFNMAVNPRSGKVYISNQEALNVNRFEGKRDLLSPSASTLRGHFVESRITVVDGSVVLPRHLNKHITSYADNLGTAADKAAALATPLEMAVTADGDMLYVVAMGSGKIARLSTAQLEDNSFAPSERDQLLLRGGGPTGMVLDEPRGRAFVLTRFDNGISVVNTGVFAEAAHIKMFNPEPAEVVKGRPFLYDARLTSSRGDSSCAGCHVFGDMDHLAWDLGDPDGSRITLANASYNPIVPTQFRRRTLHPMKGPMTTQSLRGMVGNGPMHWRGDRTGVSTGDTLEEKAFKDFNVAFEGLLGRDAPLTDAQMTSFAKYALNLSYPPNPIGALRNEVTWDQMEELELFNNAIVTEERLPTTCNSCHLLDVRNNKFGTNGKMAFDGNEVVDEDFKTPHLRNMYQKVGMFSRNVASSAMPHQGDQIRGFGFDKAGASGSIDLFLQAPVFVVNATERQKLERMLLAMPSDLNPIVGQQVTLTLDNVTQASFVNRLNLLVSRAQVTDPRPECELVAKGVIGNQARGWVMNSSQSFVSDRAGESPMTLAVLLNQINDSGSAITFTCVPPGNGTRIGVDRDSNTVLDRD